MERLGDFVQWLGPDMSIQILKRLDDPSDLIRVSAVSTSWRQFVIENAVCKNLCLMKFPEISSVVHMIEDKNMIEPVASDAEKSIRLERDHRVYAFLARGLTYCLTKDCLMAAIHASSTDNYPEESIVNTLDPIDRVSQKASYWSSRGDSDPTVPETLTYKLSSKLCLISELHVQPFQAYFQFGFPIYSAKAVRFRVGHPSVQIDLACDARDESTAAQGCCCDDLVCCDEIVWTYTSPSFPMAQENSLQKFKLPEPVLCIGGILQVELLGRAQRQEMDGLYYICVSHVQVVGRHLVPAFDVVIPDDSGKCTLKYCPGETLCSKFTEWESTSLQLQRFRTRIRGLEQMILNTLAGAEALVDDDDLDADFAM